MTLDVNFTVVAAVMLFVILISIQITLNKIYVILNDIKSLLNIKKIKD